MNYFIFYYFIFTNVIYTYDVKNMNMLFVAFIYLKHT